MALRWNETVETPLGRGAWVDDEADAEELAALRAAPVITNFVYPPIPLRQFDWCAYRDGYEPPDSDGVGGGLIGWGVSKEAAIDDLIAQELDELETPNFKVGDRVAYRGRWGRGSPEPGTITGAGVMDGGEQVYDVRLDRGDEWTRNRWGYADQFEPLNPAA